MSIFIVPADEAAHYLHTGNIAVHQARSVGCMVAIDPDKLQIYPTASQFHGVIEILEHEYMPLDLQSGQSQKTP